MFRARASFGHFALMFHHCTLLPIILLSLLFINTTVYSIAKNDDIIQPTDDDTSGNYVADDNFMEITVASIAEFDKANHFLTEAGKNTIISCYQFHLLIFNKFFFFCFILSYFILFYNILFYFTCIFFF